MSRPACGGQKRGNLMASYDSTREHGNFNRSTEKALAIVELLAASDAPLRLMDIAASLQLNQSTVLRYLTSLIHSGYVTQEAETQKYKLTFKICRIAHAFTQNHSFSRVSHPYLLQLTRDVGESSCISIPQGLRMVYIDVVTGQNNVLLSVQQIGSTAPMHCTGNGKLILSSFTEEELDAFVREAGLKRYTENTICDVQRLRDELQTIRKRGYALDNEECEMGTRCIAFPICNYTGQIIAGLSVTGPLGRMTDQALSRIIPSARSAAAGISADMGYLEP